MFVFELVVVGWVSGAGAGQVVEVMVVF